MKKGSTKYSVSVITIALLSTLVVGCVSPNASSQIKNFSEATFLTVTNTANAFLYVEENHFKEEISVCVLNYNSNGFNPETIKPFISPNALQLRFDILNGLKTYAANLSALMGNQALTNFDQNTTTLGNALSKFDTNLVSSSLLKDEPVSRGEIQILTTAVNALGRWLISYKQSAAAKAAILSMQPVVSNICQLFQKDFIILGKQLARDQNDVLRINDLFTLKHIHGFDENPYTKLAQVEKLGKLTRQMPKDAEMFAAMEDSLTKLSATHTALASLFSKKTNNISAIIGDLKTEAQRINGYYNSVKTPN